MGGYSPDERNCAKLDKAPIVIEDLRAMIEALPDGLGDCATERYCLWGS